MEDGADGSNESEGKKTAVEGKKTAVEGKKEDGAIREDEENVGSNECSSVIKLTNNNPRLVKLVVLI